MEDIRTILTEIETRKKIKILYACETGSRAWGFPSPDSDYDVRFIYMHERDWYLSLSDRKDTIEHMEGELDITGWDLRKSLVLLKKSNAALIERFQSPIEYFSIAGFKDDFKRLVESYYSPIAVFYHHYSLAKKFWFDIENVDEYKLKSWFYLVRSLLSCNWIAQDNSVLPMHIEGLMKYSTDQVNKELRELIELKKTVGEKYLHQKNNRLHDWIVDMFKTLELAKSNLVAGKTNMSLVNDFFLKKMYE
ncbi:MAG: nucleotidyltransferase domain-containing protein [Bacteroidota bacterium]